MLDITLKKVPVKRIMNALKVKKEGMVWWRYLNTRDCRIYIQYLENWGIRNLHYREFLPRLLRQIKLSEDIKENGVLETVTYDETRPPTHVFDGNHRLACAVYYNIPHLNIRLITDNKAVENIFNLTSKIYSNPYLLYQPIEYKFFEFFPLEGDKNVNIREKLNETFYYFDKKLPVIDLGCNNGFCCREAIRQGFPDAIGIEANKVFVDIKKEIIKLGLPDFKLIHTDIYSYTQNNTHEKINVIASNIFHHFFWGNKEGLVKFDKIVDWISENCKIILTDFLNQWEIDAYIKKNELFKNYPFKTEYDFINFWRDKGFKIIRYRTEDKKYKRISYVLEKTPD